MVKTSSGLTSKIEIILITNGYKDESTSRKDIETGKAMASRSYEFAILVLAEPLPMTKTVELIWGNHLAEAVRNNEPVFSIGCSSYDSTRKKDQRPRLLEAKMTVTLEVASS